MSPFDSALETDNRIYDTLGERWYSACDDPVALLRAESRLRNPWVAERIRGALGNGAQAVLDVGCGAGFLSNALAQAGHHVTGIDLSQQSLEVARARDSTTRVDYVRVDAHALPFRSDSFDVVCAMDFLEHTPRPDRVVCEVARVLRPGGLFFFHTFNRTPLSHWIVIRGVETFVRNTPARLHVYELFVKPSELRRYMRRVGLEPMEWLGVRPRLSRWGFWRMLWTGVVHDDFAFTFTRSTVMGYSGWARLPGRRAPAGVEQVIPRTHAAASTGVARSAR